MRDLAVNLVAGFACEYSCSRLKDDLGFRSVHTVQEYSNYIKEAFIYFSLKRYAFSMRKLIKSPEKVYAYDTGMASALKTNITPDYGHLMENAVAVELIRRKSVVAQRGLLILTQPFLPLIALNSPFALFSLV